MDNAKNAKKQLESKKNRARAGEVWSINDAKTKGHKSEIVKRKGEVVKHIPRTHSPITRRRHNIPLQQNPQKDDKQTAYMFPKVQTSKVKDLGKQHNEPMKNPTDKSIKRHIKKLDKKK